jgi:hypothetical protein
MVGSARSRHRSAIRLFVGERQKRVVVLRSAKCRILALRDISRRRNNSVAFGAKRTFNEPRFINPNKARGVKSAKIQTEILPQIQSFTSRLWLPMVL